MAASSDCTAGEKSGCSPRCSITAWAMAARREGMASVGLFIDQLGDNTQTRLYPASRWLRRARIKTESISNP